MNLDQLQEWRRTTYIPFLKASLNAGKGNRKLSKSTPDPAAEVIDMIRILTERSSPSPG